MVVKPVPMLVTLSLCTVLLTSAAPQFAAYGTCCESLAPIAHTAGSAAASWTALVGVTSGFTAGHALCCSCWPKQRCPAICSPVCASAGSRAPRAGWVEVTEVELWLKCVEPLPPPPVPCTIVAGGACIDPHGEVGRSAQPYQDEPPLGRFAAKPAGLREGRSPADGWRYPAVRSGGLGRRQLGRSHPCLSVR